MNTNRVIGLAASASLITGAAIGFSTGKKQGDKQGYIVGAQDMYLSVMLGKEKGLTTEQALQNTALQLKHKGTISRLVADYYKNGGMALYEVEKASSKDSKNARLIYAGA